MSPTAPYGSWRSPLTSDWLVDTVVHLDYPMARGDEVFWTESRPAEGGRQVPVRRRADGTVADLVPEAFSARTLVHEYGGACTALTGTHLLFSNFSDQRVWRVACPPGSPPAPPEPVTPEPPEAQSHRYADFSVDPAGGLVYAVRERHEPPGGASNVVNELVVLPVDGGEEPEIIASGHDFFSAPRVSPDGRHLAWICWDHPRMPWDGTTLQLADLDHRGRPGPARVVAGGPEESVTQPRWSPDGRLHYLSDRSGWWNLYADGPVFVRDAEMGGPDWVFGQSSYTFLPDGRLVVTWWEDGTTHLGVLAPATGAEPRRIETAWNTFGGLEGTGKGLLAVVASPAESAVLALIDLDSGQVETLARSRQRSLDPAYVSIPANLAFPTTGGRVGHALFYPAANPDFTGPEGELPPLVVMSHGGPTGAASSAFNPTIQYFTSRGLAVVDVNYGGSTGYGREYRRQLEGQWGIVDVDDCVNAALWLADQGKVDGRRLAIRGGSAGGYTTLAALAFRNVFAVGASHFGVADAGALARDTHKFESHYLDGLIGPWPEAEDVYRARSPIFHTDGLSCPTILFQGLEDRVVPPDQAEKMAGALRDKGLPFAHMAFEGEQHGFRKAATIRTVIEAEMHFYGRVLGFTPADPAPDVKIENADALAPAGK